MSPLLIAPEGYDAVRDQEHASRVLRYLLTCWPNCPVTTHDVCEAAGYAVGRSAVSAAAARLRVGHFGLNIRSRGGSHGGYVLLVPVPATGKRSCANCASRSVIDTCKQLKGRPVEKNQWCWGWS